MIIGEYTLLKCIGKGSFGEVYLTSKNGTNQLFATKKVSKQKVETQEVKKYFLDEISILRTIQHKNIVKLEAIRQTVHNYYIITDYYNGGGLRECLKKYQMLYGKPFPEEIIQHLTRQIIDALKYLHARKIIHRDLKLENLLINFESEEDKKNLNLLKAEIKIIDFGFATYLDGSGLRFSVLGSPINMDPILLKKLLNQNLSNLIGYDEKADIWSLGTICYELAIGENVFQAKNMFDLITKIEIGTYHVPTSFSREFVTFLISMLKHDSNYRLNAEELSRHPFLTKNVSEFTKIDLSNVADKIDEKGLILNIKSNQNLQTYYQNQNQNFNIFPPQYNGTYNYYPETNPNYYYMGNSKTQFGLQMNPSPIQVTGIQNQPLQNQQNNQVLNQIYSYKEKIPFQNHQIPINTNNPNLTMVVNNNYQNQNINNNYQNQNPNINYRNPSPNINFRNQTLNNNYQNQNFHNNYRNPSPYNNYQNQNYAYNSNTDYHKKVNKTKNLIKIIELEGKIGKKNVFKEKSYKTLPSTPRVQNLKYQSQQNKQSVKQLQRLNKNYNSHMSINIQNELFQNHKRVNRSPIPMSRKIPINNGMNTSPISLTRKNSQEKNTLYRNHFSSNNLIKDASSNALEGIINNNVGNEFSTDPDITINLRKVNL